MQRQLVQNFLKLPGIIGFSIMSLESDATPEQVYSVGFPQGLGLDQQPRLAHGIQQIIHTTPLSLEFCAFQFGLYQVELHKVEPEILLIIISQGQLTSQYSKAVSELVQFIKADSSTLVDSIQAITTTAMETAAAETVAQPQTARLQDVVEAMNSLSQVTGRYLGPQLVANHWRKLDKIGWLKQFCTITDSSISLASSNPELSPEQLAEIRLWTQRFHKQCTRIIRDYDVLIEQALSAQHWQLLFGG